LEARDVKPAVFIRFSAMWTYLPCLRAFGESFCTTTFGHTDIGERASVVIQETLENAVKYSSREVSTGIELEIKVDGPLIEISVVSTPDPTYLPTLREELASQEGRDPEAAFLAALERAVAEPHASARLGLARIRFEGNVELSLTELADGRIRVTALGKLGHGER